MSWCLQDHSSGFETGFQHQKASSSQPSLPATIFSSVLVAARGRPSLVLINRCVSNGAIPHVLINRRGKGRSAAPERLVAPAGFEPAISALRALRPRPLDDGAEVG